MFTLSELWSSGERQGSYKLLKPWWEVFMDYLLVLMLMVSILAGTLQLSRDGVVCVPVHSSSINYSSPMEPVSDSVFRSTPEPPKIPVKGRRTNLDFQQYIYISQVCYHEALPWYSRFLPYVTLLHTLVLLASGCFWFHFPLTSARIEHFLSLLAKCCESPWTTRALSLTAKLDTRFSETEQAVQAKVQVTSSYKMRKSSLDSGTDSPLLAGLIVCPLQCNRLRVPQRCLIAQRSQLCHSRSRLCLCKLFRTLPDREPHWTAATESRPERCLRECAGFVLTARVQMLSIR